MESKGWHSGRDKLSCQITSGHFRSPGSAFCLSFGWSCGGAGRGQGAVSLQPSPSLLFKASGLSVLSVCCESVRRGFLYCTMRIIMTHWAEGRWSGETQSQSHLTHDPRAQGRLEGACKVEEPDVSTEGCISDAFVFGVDGKMEGGCGIHQG
ncbi:hypothetical protein Cadr_000022052 [Camelus dromedarius]|uniref:Uncharacterized protein n=1 Tax=Camelus dromedarius TaxID=9838 RepID=A0A5N4CS94_CAMDR|nr:hypothetical protein Cadr_000022052 [Camelus dromedarius]